MNLASIVLVSPLLNVDNMAVAACIGAARPDRATRRRTAGVFVGLAWSAPVLGMVMGEWSAGLLGVASRYLGAVLLIVLGISALVTPARRPQGRWSLSRIVAVGASVSVDTCVAGFALGLNSARAGLAAATLIAAVCAVMTMVGLAAGTRLAERTLVGHVERVAAVALMAVGIGVGAGV